MLNPISRLKTAIMDCRLNAENCEGVRACTPLVSTLDSSCQALGEGQQCQGDLWLHCATAAEPATLGMHCESVEMVCNTEHQSGCGLEKCDAFSFEPRCEGDVLVECNMAGIVDRVDCKTTYDLVIIDMGENELHVTLAPETCGAHNDFGIGCIGAGDGCSTFSQECDGTILKTCAGGQFAERDCATLLPVELACGTFGSGALTGAMGCGLFEAECDIDHSDESCKVNGEISFCALTHTRTVNCKELGYSGCGTSSVDGRQIAYCKP